MNTAVDVVAIGSWDAEWVAAVGGVVCVAVRVWAAAGAHRINPVAVFVDAVAADFCCSGVDAGVVVVAVGSWGAGEFAATRAVVPVTIGVPASAAVTA